MGINIDISANGVEITYKSKTMSDINSWVDKISHLASTSPSQLINDRINSELNKYKKMLTPPKPKAIKNYDKLMKKLNKINKDAEKAVSRTASDMKSRAPAQITKAVTSVYAVKARDVTAAGNAAKKTAKPNGQIQVAANSYIDNYQFLYSGRLLTPTHFSMTPSTRPAGGKKYNVKVAIKKGAKKSLGTGVFLAPSGAGTTQIPFKRSTQKRLPIEAIRTISIPQMITNETVAERIQESLQTLLAERMKHNADRIGQ